MNILKIIKSIFKKIKCKCVCKSNCMSDCEVKLGRKSTILKNNDLNNIETINNNNNTNTDNNTNNIIVNNNNQINSPAFQQRTLPNIYTQLD